MSWRFLRGEIGRCIEGQIPELEPLLDFLDKCGAIAAETWDSQVDKPFRPGARAAACLAMRAYRTAISSFMLKASGYAEQGLVLDRVLLDIFLRLTNFLEDPDGAGTAYFLCRDEAELRSAERMGGWLVRESGDPTGVLNKEIRRTREEVDERRARVRAEGRDPTELMKKYGWLQYGKLASRIDAEANMFLGPIGDMLSEMVHARGLDMQFFVDLVDDKLQAGAGPVQFPGQALLYGITLSLLLNDVLVAADLAGVPDLEARGDLLATELERQGVQEMKRLAAELKAQKASQAD